MKNCIKLSFLAMGLWMILSGAAFAANASAGDIMILTDENGMSKDTILTQAEFSISDLDDSAEYVYCGIDVGIFKKLGTAGDWSALYIQRAETNDLNFKIDNFGDMTGYEYGNVYVIGYRVLYQLIGSTDGSVIETAWKMVPDSYFIVSRQYITSLTHKQIIRYNYSGWKEIDVAAPDQSGLIGLELDAYNRDVTFINGDMLRYKIKINVSKTDEITDTKLNLKFNTLSEPNIGLNLESALLYKEGDPNPIKTIDVSSSKVSANNFMVDLGNVLKVNGDGNYYIEYKARISVDKFSAVFAQITNTATFIVCNADGQEIPQFGSAANYKPNVITKIYKGMVQYH